MNNVHLISGIASIDEEVARIFQEATETFGAGQQPEPPNTLVGENLERIAEVPERLRFHYHCLLQLMGQCVGDRRSFRNDKLYETALAAFNVLLDMDLCARGFVRTRTFGNEYVVGRDWGVYVDTKTYVENAGITEPLEVPSFRPRHRHVRQFSQRPVR